MLNKPDNKKKKVLKTYGTDRAAALGLAVLFALTSTVTGCAPKDEKKEEKEENEWSTYSGSSSGSYGGGSYHGGYYHWVTPSTSYNGTGSSILRNTSDGYSAWKKSSTSIGPGKSYSSSRSGAGIHIGG